VQCQSRIRSEAAGIPDVLRVGVRKPELARERESGSYPSNIWIAHKALLDTTRAQCSVVCPSAQRTGPPGYEQDRAETCPRERQRRSGGDRSEERMLGFVEPAGGWRKGQVGNGRLREEDEGGGEKDDVDQDQRRVLPWDRVWERHQLEFCCGVIGCVRRL
jgi:hypothetical protein